MALTVTWKPHVGDTIILNSTYYPINETLQFELEFSDPSVRRMQQGGEWQTFGYPGSLRVIAEGQIFGDTPAQFWSKRMTFLDSLTPPNRVLTERSHGKLTISDSDQSEAMFAWCRIINRVANLETLSPQRCPYIVTFKAFTPYFQGQGTGRAYIPG
jgi:hypothetical protein